MKKTIAMMAVMAVMGNIYAATEPELKYGLDFNAVINDNVTGIVFNQLGSGKTTMSRSNGYANYSSSAYIGSEGYSHAVNGSTFTFGNGTTALDGISSSGYTIVFNGYLGGNDSTMNWADLVSFTIKDGDSPTNYKMEGNGAATLINVYDFTGETNNATPAQLTGLSAQNWYTFVVTVEDGTGKFYTYDMNGTQVGTTKTVTGMDGDLVKLRGGAGVGHDKKGNFIDNVGIYNGVLTTEQVGTLITYEKEHNTLLTTFATPSTLTETSVTSAKVLVNGVDVSITLNVEADLADVEGGFNVVVDEGVWGSIVTGMTGSSMDSPATVTLVGADGESLVLGTGTNVTINGYTGEADGKYVVKYIPESATGTLSLLALAGLCVRRRRK